MKAIHPFRYALPGGLRNASSDPGVHQTPGRQPAKQPGIYVSLCMFGLICLLLSGCATQGASEAPAAIEAYFQALTSKDANALVNASCAAWEASALQEIRTFDAVAVTLEALQCQEAGKDGETSQVNCSGKIVANYGNEVLEIDLSDRGYLAVAEGGEWRMCGYR